MASEKKGLNRLKKRAVKKKKKKNFFSEKKTSEVFHGAFRSLSSSRPLHRLLETVNAGFLSRFGEVGSLFF